MPRNKRFDHVTAFALDHPWAITPTALRVIATVLAERLAGHAPDPDVLAAAKAAQREPLPQPKRGGVAIVPVHGPLVPRADAFSEMSGMTSFDEIQANVDAALHNPDVATILLDIDSPGGSAAGATELARYLRAARAQKPIVAVGRYLVASAAYWIGAQATKLWLSPSAMAGSIGVYTMHDDLTEALAQRGIKREFISAGKYKLEGNDHGPLSEDGRAHLTAIVTATYDAFLADVAKGRGATVATVKSGYGEGRVLTADAALDAGMADAIYSIDEVFDRLLPAGAPERGAAAALGDGDTPQDRPGDTGQDPDAALYRARTEQALLALSLP